MWIYKRMPRIVAHVDISAFLVNNAVLDCVKVYCQTLPTVAHVAQL
ncbi:hypothetical protein TSTA_033570 [Talaromyces stipitatus ATCC 10500]|uniref:Uncharacterized protein n=1 Tax=Talaromyces stipitatus (strain ATCC 10500 / CBS 375.48 / QM 6759 / NRRL 1006) TaxID=441959 RepID=B8M5Y7_TALSN|nr:uncharacterized protein TSTA_033570 [Talaromyces stipitatus ATCC 10500]EED20114.1 hypothetical protein TSTA_033570 [Talaromyces stipitatus ATCC 10500]